VKITDKDIDMDTRGKDTWRFSKAGSKLVVLSSPFETDLLFKSSMDIEKIIQNIQNILDCDIILIEGVKDPNIKKIRLGRNTKKRENTIISYTNNLDEVLDKIKVGIFQKKRDR
jgi:molybdopterin-guanine dinucleotide biosynthesis protein MobB